MKHRLAHAVIGSPSLGSLLAKFLFTMYEVEPSGRLSFAPQWSGFSLHVRRFVCVNAFCNQVIKRQLTLTYIHGLLPWYISTAKGLLHCMYYAALEVSGDVKSSLSTIIQSYITWENF